MTNTNYENNRNFNLIITGFSEVCDKLQLCSTNIRIPSRVQRDIIKTEEHN